MHSVFAGLPSTFSYGRLLPDVELLTFGVAAADGALRQNYPSSCVPNRCGFLGTRDKFVPVQLLVPQPVLQPHVSRTASDRTLPNDLLTKLKMVALWTRLTQVSQILSLHKVKTQLLISLVCISSITTRIGVDDRLPIVEIGPSASICSMEARRHHGCLRPSNQSNCLGIPCCEYDVWVCWRDRAKRVRTNENYSERFRVAFRSSSAFSRPRKPWNGQNAPENATS